MNGFSLSCTALVGTNKAGTLKCDADGYYQMVLGALDVYNSGGAFYPEASARHLFAQSSSLMRRIASGNLRGECGHPRPQPGWSMDDFVNRVRDIYEPNVCMHIRKVTVDYSTYRNANGQPIITIIGEVKPSGPMGPALKESIENRHEDVCFSVRSLTNDVYRNGRVEKNFRMIVTWDYVNEPGLAQAHKWNAPSLENFKELPNAPVSTEVLVDRLILPGQLYAMQQRSAASGVSMESDHTVSLEEFVEAVSVLDDQPKPPSAKW